MILKVNMNSLWMPDKFFTKTIPGCRSQPKTRGFWKFFHNGKSLVFRDKDCTEDISTFLKIDSEELIGLLRDYLEKYKAVVGIECQDGLFVHPDTLGRVLMRIKAS